MIAMVHSHMLASNVELLTKHLDCADDNMTRVLVASFYIYIRGFLDGYYDAPEPDLRAIEACFREGESQPKSKRLWLEIKAKCNLRFKPSKSRPQTITADRPTKSRPMALTPWVLADHLNNKEGWVQKHHATHFVAWVMYLLETQDYYGPGEIADRATAVPQIHRWLCVLQSLWLSNGVHVRDWKLELQLRRALMAALDEVTDRVHRRVCFYHMFHPANEEASGESEKRNQIVAN